MAKPAGGPKVKDKNPNWDEDWLHFHNINSNKNNNNTI